ncbi:MAG: PINc/VapC family ATPase [Candidatus Altiarchaeota archaeon]
MKADKIVPDTSVIVDGRITQLIKDSTKSVEVLIPNAVVAELEHQANLGRETGFDGLQELKELGSLKNANIKFVGEHPRGKETSRIDEIIRDTAEEHAATLVTSDRVQALVAEAKNIQVEYLESIVRVSKPKIFDLFDGQTMSLHVKEGVPVYAKKGSVGEFELVKVADKISREDLDKIVRDVVEYTKASPQGYIEMEERGATVIQLEDYRIVITRPPFSDGIELTVVKPLVKTKLSDYGISEKLSERLGNRAEGVFVAGSPGAGKTTFVQALAEFYRLKGKIVKTMENPRDLQVDDEITQYSALGGDMSKTGDILLLVRPDYTIFDEMRKTHDFKVFADMRLAGVGLVGVTHASQAIDAIQRLVGRVELGVIPHVVDTLIFLKAGRIEKVYALGMTVKVPHGMTESDLSRPVIQIKDFESNSPEYEMYSYGEEVVVIPVGRSQKQQRTSSGVEISQTKKQFIIRAPQARGQHIKVYADGSFLFSSKVNHSGTIKVKRNSDIGRLLLNVLSSGKALRAEG